MQTFSLVLRFEAKKTKAHKIDKHLGAIFCVFV